MKDQLERPAVIRSIGTIRNPSFAVFHTTSTFSPLINGSG
jgi:hypothetical protein